MPPCGAASWCSCKKLPVTTTDTLDVEARTVQIG
jgi:hypothetical protein